ncbi:MAG: hypothetical protein IKA82_02810 [Clostridia bacterium]|nr:hypothetical protein [Clostridia bacterium]
MNINEKIKVVVIGGDARQLYVTKHLELNGLSAIHLCTDSSGSLTLKEALDGAHAVILPLPSSNDGVRINSPRAIRFTELVEITSALSPTPLILGGKLPPSFKNYAKEKGVKAIDYYENESLQIKNALPTAEGAVYLAMQELDITLDSCRAAVTGYGRISKALCALLKAMGAEVTVAARRQSDLAYAGINRYKTLRITHVNGISSLSELCQGYDVIFNTVPCWIFDRSLIQNISHDTKLIELASAPGGFDIGALNDCGVTVIRGAALPGRYAPSTAGRIISETVIEILQSEGIL